MQKDATDKLKNFLNLGCQNAVNKKTLSTKPSVFNGATKPISRVLY